jgi:hypothetical protein
MTTETTLSMRSGNGTQIEFAWSRLTPRWSHSLVGVTQLWNVQLLMKFHRAFFFSILTIPMLIGLFLWLVLWYGDIMPQDADYPPSFIENVGGWVCLLALWPFYFTSFMLGSKPSAFFEFIYIFPLFFTPLFWGFIIEYIYIKTRRRPNNREAV